jgi:hypothetical protein
MRGLRGYMPGGRCKNGRGGGCGGGGLKALPRLRKLRPDLPGRSYHASKERIGIRSTGNYRRSQ